LFLKSKQRDEVLLRFLLVTGSWKIFSFG